MRSNNYIIIIKGGKDELYLTLLERMGWRRWWWTSGTGRTASYSMVVAIEQPRPKHKQTIVLKNIYRTVICGKHRRTRGQRLCAYVPGNRVAENTQIPVGVTEAQKLGSHSRTTEQKHSGNRMWVAQRTVDRRDASRIYLGYVCVPTGTPTKPHQ
jgi:hypothetical protein